MKKISLVLMVFYFAFPSEAAEIDSFSMRHLPLNDSLVVLNQVTNEYFQRAIAKANSTRSSCHRPTLYSAFEKTVAAQFEAQIETLVGDRPDIFDQHRPETKKSIYRDFFFMKKAKMLPFGELGPVINVGGIYMGADKIGHFFTEGLGYFKRVHNMYYPIKLAMRWGESLERGVFGLGTTGVYSSADLVANFNGFRFWGRLIGDMNDPLGERLAPYLACQNKKWVQVRSFDWAEYTDQAWDEGFNCPQFLKDKSTKSVMDVLSEVSANIRSSVECKSEILSMPSLQNKYKSYRSRLFNTYGLKTFDY